MPTRRCRRRWTWCARAVGHGPVGFVNAILRKISQRDEDLWVQELAPPITEDLIGHLAFQYAHPKWIAEVFDDALGGSAGALQAALAADDERPLTHLVARPGLLTAEELALITGGEVGRYSPYCVYLDGGDPGDLDPIREGIAGVQDEGSQLVARALAQAPLVGDDNGRWLDLCAGPGGKAALLGALAEIDGTRVDAIEKAPHRAELVRKATRDLPVDVKVADGRDPRSRSPDTTGFSSTHPAPVWVRCAAVPRPAGDAAPTMSPNSLCCNDNCSNRR